MWHGLGFWLGYRGPETELHSLFLISPKQKTTTMTTTTTDNDNDHNHNTTTITTTTEKEQLDLFLGGVGQRGEFTVYRLEHFMLDVVQARHAEPPTWFLCGILEPFANRV